MNFNEKTQMSQSARAAQLAEKFLATFRSQLENDLRTLAGEQQLTLDPVAANELVLHEVRRDVLSVLVGYTDWLGFHLWSEVRDKPKVRELPLPTFRPQDVEQLCNEYDVEDQEIAGAIVDLIIREHVLPPLGTIDHERVSFDPEWLSHWARQYSWHV